MILTFIFCSLLYRPYNKDTPIILSIFYTEKKEKNICRKGKEKNTGCFFFLHGVMFEFFAFSRMYDYFMKLDNGRPLVAIFSASLCPPFEGHLIGVLPFMLGWT